MLIGDICSIYTDNQGVFSQPPPPQAEEEPTELIRRLTAGTSVIVVCTSCLMMAVILLTSLTPDAVCERALLTTDLRIVFPSASGHRTPPHA